MRADPADQLRLLDLQTIDTTLDQLAHRRRGLPELAEIASLDERLTALRDDVTRAETDVADLDRDQRKLEADVDQVRQRSDRDQQRIQSSTSAKEAESLQHEIGSLRRRQDDLEDQLLEVMERREEAVSQLTTVREQVADLTRSRDDAIARRDAAHAEIDASAAARTGERSTTAAILPADLLALYERIRASSGGTGAAALYRRRCQGCHLELSGHDLSDVRSAAPDEVVRCEECRRILVRTAESGL